VARWTPKRKLVAVKVLKSAMLTATQSIVAVELLMQEAQGLARASDNGVNAHVVQVFGVCQGVADGWQTAQRAARRAESLMERRKQTRSMRTLKAAGGIGSGGGVGGDAAAAAACANCVGSGGSVGGAGMPAPAVSSDQSGGSDGCGSHSADAPDDIEDEADAGMGSGAGTAAGAGASGSVAAVAEGADGPAPYLFGLVMSFESGGSLQETLFPERGGGASWPAAMLDRLRVLKEVATGLYQLHAIGLVHGDLKLDNVRRSRAHMRACGQAGKRRCAARPGTGTRLARSPSLARGPAPLTSLPLAPRPPRPALPTAGAAGQRL